MGFFEGKCLIATPAMEDERFKNSVVFICANTQEGSMGLMINKPSTDITFNDLMFQLKIEQNKEITPPVIFSGGPVDVVRGFVLHSNDYKNESTLQIGHHASLTVTAEVLRDIAIGNGPKNYIIALGYVGWDEGQLETEVKENAWLPVSLSADLIFDNQYEKKWQQGLESIGVTPAFFSATQGQA